MEQLSIYNIYNILLKRYGPQDWWPAKGPYEVAVGAVLTQNTAWSNVEKAIARFNDNLTPWHVLSLTHEELINIIAPSGYYNSKARTLRRLTEWYMEKTCAQTEKKSLSDMRRGLLSIKGIGPETADSILLYAFNLPVFVVDTYTRRLLERIGFDVPKRYDDLRAVFENSLPVSAALYNEYHALIVTHCKTFCRKKPLCDDCALRKICIAGSGL